MPKRSSKKTEDPDTQQIAKRVLDVATGQKPEKNPAAVALGRAGGLKGGKARAEKLTKEHLSAIGKKGAEARWKTKEKEQGES